MQTKRSRFFCAGVALILLGTGTFGTPEAVANDKYRRDFRRHDGEVLRAAAADRDYRRHERDRRAFIAGAVVQQHRNDYRDGERYGYRGGYDDRYRDRYYRDDDDDDNKIGAALVGAAVGAVVTGMVMSNRDGKGTSTTTSGNDSR